MIIRPLSIIYDNRNTQMLENTLSDILLFTVLYVLVAMLVDVLVVNNLKRVNVSLDRITNGHLDEKVWVRTSTEFSALSDDINQTVTALRGYIDQAEKRMQQELKLYCVTEKQSLIHTLVLWDLSNCWKETLL